MFTDAQHLLSDAQAVTADAGSTNVIDLSAVREIGQGEPMGVAIRVDVAADGTTTDETYAFKLQTDDAAAFGSATDLTPSLAIGYATLVAGYLFVIPLSNVNTAAMERYLRLYYDVGGTTPTITCTAWLTPLNMVAGRAKIYADAITIS